MKKSFHFLLPILLAMLLPLTASGQWIRRTGVSTPGQRTGHAMAFDRDRGLTVFFGGEIGAGGDETYFNDTWEYDGATWRRITISGPIPDTRSGHAMCYDTVHHQVLMVGGVNEDRYLPDFWAYQSDGPGLGHWTVLHPAYTGVDDYALAGAVLVFDESRGVAIRIGGEGILQPATGNSAAVTGVSRSISYFDRLVDANPSWSNVSMGSFGSARLVRSAAAYDPLHGKVLFYGGKTYNGNSEYNDSYLWGFVLGTPREVVNTAGTFIAFDNPYIRYAAVNTSSRGTQQSAMVFDTLKNRAIVFGGQNDPNVPSQPFDDQTSEFVLSGNPASNDVPFAGPYALAMSVKPPGRAGHAMVYDSIRHVVVMFGGASGDTRYDDTWELPSVPPQPAVWFDSAFTGTGNGTVDAPFNSLVQAVQTAEAEGKVVTVKGPRVSPATFTLTTHSPVTIQASGGPVTFGKQP